MNPTDPREGKPPFVMPLIHGLNCEKVCHERANGYLHAPDDDGPYDVDGLKYCGRCHTWLPETPEQLQSTNSRLAAEIAELKRSRDAWAGKAQAKQEFNTRLIDKVDTLRAELEAEQAKRKDTAKDFETAFRLVRQDNDRLSAELEAARKERDEALNKLWEEKQRASAAESAAYDRGRSHELTEGNWLEVEKERNQLHEELEVQIEATRAAGAVCQRLERQRDTAIAAKDAAEKERNAAVQDFNAVVAKDKDRLDWLEKHVANVRYIAPHWYSGRPDNKSLNEDDWSSTGQWGNLRAAIDAALTPAPTQEPPAGGVTISNDSSLPKAGNNAETREGIVPAPSDGKCDSAAIVLLPRDDREQVGQATPDVRPVPAVTISTEKKGGDELCAQKTSNTLTTKSRLPESLSQSEPQPSSDESSASNSPADVPSVGRGELLPFNLSDALSGKPVVTRDRWKASNIQGDKLLGGIVNGIYYNWYLDGKCTNGNPLHDLFMLPTEGSGA